MPYIPQDDRFDLFNEFVFAINASPPRNAGDIQYMIARIIDLYLYTKEGARYQDMNDVMGSLAGAQMEFYRCVVAPYEDLKIMENGGVYGRYDSGKSY